MLLRGANFKPKRHMGHYVLLNDLPNTHSMDNLPCNVYCIT